MSTIVKFNNKVLRLNNKTVGWTAPVPPPVLYHVTTNGVNGTVVATPNTGYNGDTITLSNTPDEGYEFDSYSLTGATLYDTNKFDIDNSDVNVVGNFKVATEPVYIETGYISQNQLYAGWYKSQLDAAGATYNSTYKFVSDNLPTADPTLPPGAWYVYLEGNIFDSNYSIIVSPTYTTASDNYTFSFSDILTETQYNNMFMFNTWLVNADPALIPLDLKLQVS